MNSNKKIEIGQNLLYTGKSFDGFDDREPHVTFLGYDSNSWKDIWVDYKQRKVLVNIRDVKPDIEEKAPK